MAPVKKNVNEFDLTLLGQMQEPLQIRVVRVNKGTGGREPIPLPQAEWSKADAQNIEQIILNDISGGGSYEGEISGASGKNFKWKFAYPETYFPSKTPPGSLPATAPVPPVSGMAGAPVGAVWTPQMAAQGYRPPPQVPAAYGAPMPQQFNGQQPGAYATPRFTGAMQPQYQIPGQFTGYAPPAYSPYMPQVPPTPGAGDQALRRELEQTRRDAAATEHRREREASEAKHAADMAAMRDELRRISEASAQKPRGDDDPVLLAMKQQNDTLKLQMEQQARALESEKAERARAEQDARHREEASRRDENHRREMDELKRLIAEGSSNKTDPMMMMMMEHMRSAADAQRDQNRVSAEAAAENARAAQGAPQQLMGLVESIRRSSGADTLMQNVAGAYDGAMGMMTRNMEMVNQMVMGQQGSPVAALIGEGMENVKEVLGNVMTERQKTEQAQAKQAEAEANAKIMHEQVVYATATATAEAQRAAETGTPEAAQAATEAKANAEEASVQHAAAVTASVQAEAEVEAAEEVVLGHEEKIFGVALAEVQRLRTQIDDMEPTLEAANIVGRGVVMAAVQIKAQKLNVPAFVLFDDQRYADLVDHLLPGQTSEFVGMCVSEITRLGRLVQVRGVEALDSEEADPPAPPALTVVPDPEPEAESEPEPEPEPAATG